MLSLKMLHVLVSDLLILMLFYKGFIDNEEWFIAQYINIPKKGKEKAIPNQRKGLISNAEHSRVLASL